jgi:hypothetical protein
MGEMRNAHSILFGIRLVRSRSGWEDIRMDLIERVWECVEWIHHAQDIDQFGFHTRCGIP